MFTMLRLSLKELKKDALQEENYIQRIEKNIPDIQRTKPPKKWVNVNQYKNLP